MPKPKAITKTEEARLRECLELDPNSPSGLTWKIRLSNRAGAGSPAGWLATGKNDYQRWSLKLDGRHHQVHNIIWLFLSDQWPADLYPLTVDHINRDASDNSYDNIRLATKSEQTINRRAHGTSSFRYVHWDQGEQKWRASWKHLIAKKTINVGYFTDELTAHRAALASRLERYNLLTGEWL